MKTEIQYLKPFVGLDPKTAWRMLADIGSPVGEPTEALFEYKLRDLAKNTLHTREDRCRREFKKFGIEGFRKSRGVIADKNGCTEYRYFINNDDILQPFANIEDVERYWISLY